MAFYLPLLHSKNCISNPSRKYPPLLSSSSNHTSPPILHLLHHPITKISTLHRLSSCTNFAFSPLITIQIVNKCFSQRQSTQKQDEEEIEEEEEEDAEEGEIQFERLFSNLNQATLKGEPGSLISAIFLVAGTTVGAGILAIPAVTQEAGFLASAVTCILCWAFMVVSGLLIAEVNVKTMCELGSGGVSLVSMAMRTLGTIGVQTTW
ncbi:unnamed protein product [Ilex paraguariensis]|uniref:Tyrosine-specific transport protein n=1 Tax=Ilex paraguariensis TaxID=185542 RepID=A0ABC8R1G5_9AQUA